MQGMLQFQDKEAKRPQETQQPKNTMTQTPTPRTDEVWHQYQNLSYQQRFNTMLTNAEELETELTAMTQERDKLQSENDSLCRELDVMQQELDRRPL